MSSRAMVVAIGGLLIAACSFNESGIDPLDAGGGVPDARTIDGQIGPDAPNVDASSVDAAVIDAGVDGAVPDAMVPDAMVPDGMVPDALVPDALVPDAMMPDALVPDALVPDAPTDAAITYSVVETLTINCNSNTGVTSGTVLTAGVTYRLRASGTCSIGPWNADAEYYNFAAPADTSGGSDYGIGIDDATFPDWGAYTSTHIYEIAFVGAGATITAQFYDPVGYANNSGSLTLEILAPN